MNGVDIVEITTKDGLVHQGVYAVPSSFMKDPGITKTSAGMPKKSKTAILFIHGLTSAFYHQLPLQTVLIEACRKKGYGYASFNNRGHDFLASTYKVDLTHPKGKRHVTIGAGVEHFSSCISDIDAGVTFLNQRGYTSVILIGHSTGANKVCYYIGTQDDKRVQGVVLAAPVSDRLYPALHYLPLKRLFLTILVYLGFGDRIFTNINYFPITPRRALSLIAPHSDEDVFDYGEKNPRMHYYAMIRLPLLVLWGAHDEYADRPVSSIQKVFDAYTHSTNYTSVILSETTHGFDGKEKECVRVICNWIATI